MDKLGDIDLNWLRSLSHLLETESVSGAARRAGVGQPAMSRTLAHLRELFGDPLLVRVGRRSRLTEHAIALKPRVHDALSAAQLAFRAPARFDPAQRFEVRIAANDYLHTALLLPWLSTVGRTAPGLKLIMEPVSAVSIGKLATGDIDFALGPAIAQPELRLSRFSVRPLWSDRFVCVLRAGHPALRGRFDLKKLLSLSHVRVVCGDFRASCEAALERLDVARKVVCVAPSFLQALTLVRSTDLVGLVPARLVQAAGDGFETRPLPFAAESFPLFMAFHPRSQANAQHRWVSQSLLEFAQTRDAHRPEARNARA